MIKKFMSIKRIYKAIIAIISSILLFSIVLVLGRGHDPYIEKMKTNVSEIRNTYYNYISEDIAITFFSGQREEPYIVDGKKENLVDFGIISVQLNAEKFSCQNVVFEINENEKNYEAILEKNPYNSQLMYDIGEQIICDDFMVKITDEENEINVKLTNVSKNWNIDCNEALDIGLNKFKKDILKEVNEFNCEIYVKILSEATAEESNFWFVDVVFSNGEEYYCAVDVNNGNIVTMNYLPGS